MTFARVYGSAEGATLVIVITPLILRSLRSGASKDAGYRIRRFVLGPCFDTRPSGAVRDDREWNRRVTPDDTPGASGWRIIGLTCCLLEQIKRASAYDLAPAPSKMGCSCREIKQRIPSGIGTFLSDN